MGGEPPIFYVPILIKVLFAKLRRPAFEPNTVVRREITRFLHACPHYNLTIPIPNGGRNADGERHERAEYDILQAMPGLMLFECEPSVFVYDEEWTRFKAAPTYANFKVDEVMESFGLMPTDEQSERDKGAEQRHENPPST